ncbi:hypothetical protein DPX39_010032800 [Trypanosoma brucei equiperdum]|uniref:Uncharacterized protein n=1 Tax=Trypanosoma brucei equiperdum TaxID=630700 RepID=A0A3L6LCH0_9TRYP|nr:hypothetical protein DPX39_010032800 [Trypanosoma brucei equiperdum]
MREATQLPSLHTLATPFCFVQANVQSNALCLCIPCTFLSYCFFYSIIAFQLSSQ